MKAYWPLYTLALLAIVCLATVYLVAPKNLPVVAYKVLLVSIGTLIGYVANEFFLKIDNEVAQSIIIAAAVWGMTAGV